MGRFDGFRKHAANMAAPADVVGVGELLNRRQRCARWKVSGADRGA
jgi:hypothetical protein